MRSGTSGWRDSFWTRGEQAAVGCKVSGDMKWASNIANVLSCLILCKFKCLCLGSEGETVSLYGRTASQLFRTFCRLREKKKKRDPRIWCWTAELPEVSWTQSWALGIHKYLYFPLHVTYYLVRTSRSHVVGKCKTSCTFLFGTLFYEIGSRICHITLRRTRQFKGKFIRLAIVNVSQCNVWVKTFSCPPRYVYRLYVE